MRLTCNDVSRGYPQDNSRMAARVATEKRRRQHGTGSIHRRASDDRWIGTIEAGWTAKGTRRRITVSATTEAECRRLLRDRQRQIARDGLPSTGTAASTTVKAWAEQWSGRRGAEVRRSSAATDVSLVRRWIVPTIGTRRLDRLTPADIRAVGTAIMSAGRSSSTAQRAHVVLTKMLRDARMEGHEVPPRVLEVRAPTKAASDREAIAIDDAHALLRAAADTPDAARWVAALLQGMRQGECLGLTWDRVDLDAGTLDVSWQLDTLKYADRRAGTFVVRPGLAVRHLVGAWHLVPPKTARGQRIIPLVPWMTAALRAWREVCPASPWGLVWPDEHGMPRRDVDDRAAWYALQDAAGVRHPSGRRYTLHEGRHTTATLLLEAGVDPAVVTAILGHSSIITSRGYMHVSQALARRALDDVADRLGLTLPTVAALEP